MCGVRLGIDAHLDRNFAANEKGILFIISESLYKISVLECRQSSANYC
jgi:hypothetical protein